MCTVKLLSEMSEDCVVYCNFRQASVDSFCDYDNPVVANGYSVVDCCCLVHWASIIFTFRHTFEAIALCWRRGFTKFSRDDYVQWKREGRFVKDGVNAKVCGVSPTRLLA